MTRVLLWVLLLGRSDLLQSQYSAETLEKGRDGQYDGILGWPGHDTKLVKEVTFYILAWNVVGGSGWLLDGA